MASSAEAVPAVEQIPVVDLAPFRAGTRAGKDQVAKDIRSAAEDNNFLYIKNHGVPQEAINAAFAASKRFFTITEADKLAIKINKWHRGYLPFNNAVAGEGLKPNLSESFLVGGYLPQDDPDVLADIPMHGPNQWPVAMPEIRPVLEAGPSLSRSSFPSISSTSTIASPCALSACCTTLRKRASAPIMSSVPPRTPTMGA